MAQALSSSDSVSYLNPLVLAQQEPVSQEHVQAKARRRFSYLLANRIRFVSKTAGAVHLKKPVFDTMITWMEKIIVGEQCAVLYVEDLDILDTRVQRIKALCELHNVTLVNLTLETDRPNNLLLGPWH